MSDEPPLLVARPSWWNFFWHLLFSWLIIPLVVAWWKRNSLTLRVYSDRVVLETGMMSREISDVFITDIRGIDVTQGPLQRLAGIGNIEIGTSATGGWEEIAYGLPDPLGIRDLILEQRRKLTEKGSR